MVLLGNIGAPPTITVAAKAGVARARAVTSASVFRVLRVDMTFLVTCGLTLDHLPDETPSDRRTAGIPHPSPAITARRRPQMQRSQSRDQPPAGVATRDDASPAHGPAGQEAAFIRRCASGTG